MKLKIKIIFILALTASYNLYAENNSNRAGQGGTGITINNIRNFQINENTVLTLDGEIISSALGQGGTGYKARYQIGEGVDQSMTQGVIEVIDFINTHKGPVTSIEPFRIFNIDTLITADTFYDDNLTFEDISVNDELKISGFVDSNSTLIASRIESDNDPLTEWKLSGYISNFTGSQFNIQNQVVIVGGIIDDTCTSGLINGEFVEIKATPDINFTMGSELTTVTKIECVPEGVDTLPGDVIPVALEGLVDFADIDNNQFSIAGQIINISLSTLYINGEIDDIVVGAKLEVEGLMNTTTSVIDALKIKFKEVRFKFEEPVSPEDVIPNESIQLFGQVILTTPQLRDEDGIMSSGLGVATQVEVRGYADGEGNLYATRVRERNEPDPTDVNADGKITAINDPIIEIYGVVVDTTNSLFLDINGMPISSVEFFNQIVVGTQVEVDDAVVNSDIISGGIIRIDEEDDNTDNRSSFGISQGLGIGTVTFNDEIFSNSFE
ncbi:MAG: DUF5666 domain-containing protein [Marinicellaceae bacterium]